MNPTEIADALEEIANCPFDGGEFPFVFAAAMGSPQATVSKLRSGTINKSKVHGAVLMNRKFYAIVTDPGGVDAGLAMIRSDKKTATHKPPILLATDGEEFSAENTATGERLHIKRTELHRHFGFFLPAAGMQRYKAADENPVDIKATGQLAKLYDALLKDNPSWQTPERRHDLNLLMTRLVFCMFAEDVGIFDDNLFSRLIFTHAGDNGEEAQLCLTQAFAAMNRQKDTRGDLPDWTAELPFVNGGLFADTLEVPRFYRGAYRYLKDAAGLDWREINPDIFGSMIQTVADPEKRSELGMHYTSVPNILKVLGPLFLDDLDAQIDKAQSARALQKVLDRIAGIRVFDPACGSGNFLVVAYRELRRREIAVLERMAANRDAGQGSLMAAMVSGVRLDHFYGIEITDFAAETAKLALFIAEYQANARFADVFGQSAAALPLRDGGNIVCGNALRLDWETVCPPPGEDEEVFIAGNPPFLGSTYQSKEQKADQKQVFEGHIKSFAALDFVTCWFFKASLFVREHGAKSALVATNSISQGYSAAALWPLVLEDDVEIGFAHQTFKWANNASANAAVMCVVVGLRRRSTTPKVLITGQTSKEASNINAYLIDAPDTVVVSTRTGLFGLPAMDYGNKPVEGGHLILSPTEAAELRENPKAARFIRPFMGSQEVVKGLQRFCLWINDEDVAAAREVPEIAARIDKVREFRLGSTDNYVVEKLANRPHRFKQVFHAQERSILIPSVSSENRPYLPVDRVGADVIVSNLSFALYDAPEWCLALIGSRLHLVWIGTVCGKLKSDFRYSNTLGWNTFPVPRFTEDQLAALNASAREILRTRYMHHPKTIAQLYDPDKMPDDLRAVHKANDDLLEEMYIGRPFRNDTERLERLFKLYAARIEKLKAEDAA
ncbi:MAG: DNA methyltransferase [Paracoccaceae bacterium]